MNKVEVLISAMHQNDLRIAERTGIYSDALIINQCDVDECIEEQSEVGTIRCISTKERGLSRSRNMALNNATGDYCLICDDDEKLEADYPTKIRDAFEQHCDADIIAFIIKREGKSYSNNSYKVGYLQSLRIASWQICFDREKLLNSGVQFDENFGSGTPVGSGEENIFLFECLKAKLKIYFVPVCLGEVAQKQSNWFKGFNEEYFYNRGMILQRMMGKTLARFYSLYFLISKYPRYSRDISLFKAWKYMKQGINKKVLHMRERI